MCKHNVTLCAEVDVLTNSLQSQIMQCSEKLQNVISRTLQALVNVLNVKGKVLKKAEQLCLVWKDCQENVFHV